MESKIKECQDCGHFFKESSFFNNIAIRLCDDILIHKCYLLCEHLICIGCWTHIVLSSYPWISEEGNPDTVQGRKLNNRSLQYAHIPSRKNKLLETNMAYEPHVPWLLDVAVDKGTGKWNNNSLWLGNNLWYMEYWTFSSTT